MDFSRFHKDVSVTGEKLVTHFVDGIEILDCISAFQLIDFGDVMTMDD
jgi:hypothetical protein